MFEALIAATGVALLSLIGAFFFGSSHDHENAHHSVLPIAIGVFLGVVFFELIPETLDASHEWGAVTILAGFLGFYLLSHFLDTFHHHHADDHDTCGRNGARLLLIGDAIHNTADGIVIASAFMLDPTIGILTTIGIALHEIPQEIAEFGVLLHSGCMRSRALLYNFLSATTVVFGVLITYGFATLLNGWVFVLTGVAAGNLLYIATSDFIPELRHSHREHFYRTFTMTLIAILCIGALVLWTHRITPEAYEGTEGTLFV